MNYLMYKIWYSEKSSIKIENFINSYKNNFFKLFFDTWIETELDIIKNYESLWDRFYDSIKSEIRKIFTENTIYWISYTKEWKQFTTISINNFRLFVYYEEIKDEKLRIIEDIEFFRK